MKTHFIELHLIVLFGLPISLVFKKVEMATSLKQAI